MKLKPGTLAIVLLYFIFMLITAFNKQQTFLALHPQNPHYFIFREKPMVLIGSTEHYGAVLNMDFNYIKYLDETASKGMNVTRTFTGIYLEPGGAFGIAKNTLAPESGKLICPWARSSEPGYVFGGNKFDLTKWDEAYFVRLKDFIKEAGKRNIIVELDLFSNFYDTLQWKLSPLYYSNNINNVPVIRDHKEVLSLRHPEILRIQEKMVQKIIEELKGFDNLYYEVCNEPYFGDIEALESWEQHMTNVIAGAEKDFLVKHLVSQNIANGSLLVENPNPFVSVFNFHYAKPPVVVEMNYKLDKVIGDNETGFNGTEDVNYRTEAWDFLVAGGGLYNNLDYSFTTGHEDGSFDYPASQPGGGGSSLRAQLGILKNVFNEIDFINMKPLNKVLMTSMPGQTTCRVFAKEGEQYLLYINNSHKDELSFSIDLPEGNYAAEWIDTKTGQRTKLIISEHQGGAYELNTPVFSEDISLKIIRNK
jgi:hypothetical protein